MATNDDILQLEERRWTAQIGEDSAAMTELFADELRYTHSTGLVDTKESYMTAIQNKVFDYRHAERRDTEVQVFGNVALVTGAATIDVVAGGRELQLNARYTVTWLERDGRWQFLSWQSTPLAAK
ncbi:MAG: nuclear transport factor 2 family protein [Acidimicrobiales bacterium]